MREVAPSKDSIRRDQIKLLASSAPEADRLTVCPIWVSGTVEAGAWGSRGHCNQLHRHPWGPLTPTVTTTLRDILSESALYNKSPFNMDAIFASQLCVTIWRKHVNKDVRVKVGSGPSP